MSAHAIPAMVIDGKPVRVVPPNGCHSSVCPDKFKTDSVRHSTGAVIWPNRMSRQCRYDEKENDRRCDGCQHPWDQVYVEAIRSQKEAA